MSVESASARRLANKALKVIIVAAILTAIAGFLWAVGDTTTVAEEVTIGGEEIEDISAHGRGISLGVRVELAGYDTGITSVNIINNDGERVVSEQVAIGASAVVVGQGDIYTGEPYRVVAVDHQGEIVATAEFTVRSYLPWEQREGVIQA